MFQQSDDVSEFSNHNLFDPRILDESNSYSSKIFLVKYANERVNISESVVFRLEYEMNSTNQTLPLFIESKLFYSDFGGNVVTEHVLQSMQNPRASPQFSCVNLSNIKINRPTYGISQMFPITFTNVYASVLNLSIHTMLVDFQFNDIAEITQSLFPGDSKTVSSDRLDRVYEDYVVHLAITHNKIRRNILEYFEDLYIEDLVPRVTKEVKLPVVCDDQTEEKRYEICDQGLERNLYSKCIKTRKKRRAARCIMNEMREVAGDLCQIKYVLLEILKQKSQYIISLLETTYVQNS